ncbi:type III-A CRISPR-associated RAMP protein Csm5 [Petralouisia muris]|uniref:Type III-A CRISPR-associated RAMP protein Csm5 n=1 Tax=Petralouisia muris TaxID=3032872 RepID=A0AC61S036_9FIRM|nr:type III-A CRISPR-associated RAMP protein Csm5 [Petralouisia muris]TGY97292.1 type III-A CRISPR-associated RAMP protein Csm5 [Petralouisia muris]
MSNILKTYDLELTAAGPVYIGSGKEIGKKEYAFSPWEKKISVMDMAKLCQLLNGKNLMSQYEKFMLGNSRDDVGKWLEKNKVLKKEYQKCVRYQLECQDAVIDSRSKLSVLEFVKDAYGMPYVPGSSVKGMLRTILLAYDIAHDFEKYKQIKNDISGALKRNKGRNRNICKRESAAMEYACYRTLNRLQKEPRHAVNDAMAGMIVSDSKPLSVEELVLCQRTELHADGREKKLNVLREALRPGTVIHVTITIDSSICGITKEYLEQALAFFGEMYYECFLRKYPDMDMPFEDSVWLGGGTGFVTKTEVYPLFGKEEGVETVVNLFKATGVPENHKHYLDRKRGVSPHICKVAYYEGKRYQMGLCRAKITKCQ